MNFRAIRLDTPLTRALLVSLLAHALLFWRDSGPAPAPAGGALRAHLRQSPGTGAEPVAPSVRPETPDTPRAPQERRYDDGGTVAQAPAAPTQEEPLPTQALNAGIDLGNLRQYHVALGRNAARYRLYPPQARAAGWEGRVPMRLVISASGTPVGLGLIGSSGHAILDQAALDMMRLAAGHTPVPDSLRGQEFTIDLAVDYNLADEQ